MDISNKINRDINIGGLFSGVGGFELGLQLGIPNSYVDWMIEEDDWNRKVLHSHWSDAKLYADIRFIRSKKLSDVDIICGGFPCQDLSIAGHKKGFKGEKSSLWFEMLRIIRDLRPKVAVMENVANILKVEGQTVIGSLAEIGYSCEWQVISARDVGAPHLRRRWFCIAYPNFKKGEVEKIQKYKTLVHNTCSIRLQKNKTEQDRVRVRGKKFRLLHDCQCCDCNRDVSRKNYWREVEHPPRVRRVDHGISIALDRRRLKAMGNAIVPQCSYEIGKYIYKSGLLFRD
jgi:DNA (cytosine-5)-methyltransferase 1